MIDPLNPLFQTHDQMAASITPYATDPQSALALMIVGIIIILATGLGSLGGLSAAVWVRLSERRESRLHAAGRTRK